MLRSVAVSLCCVCIASACLDDSNPSATVFAPTLLSVDPATFLGSVRCGSELQKYVVTLFEVSTGRRVSLGSSPPTDCTTRTTFGTNKISAGNTYIAEIDGYDQVDIVPEGGNESGSRVINDRLTMTRVFPRWQTSCGEILEVIDGEVPDATLNPLRYPTIPLGNREVTFHGCLPFRAAELPDAGVVESGSPDGPPDATTSDAAQEAPEDASGADVDAGGEGGIAQPSPAAQQGQR